MLSRVSHRLNRIIHGWLPWEHATPAMVLRSPSPSQGTAVSHYLQGSDHHLGRHLRVIEQAQA